MNQNPRINKELSNNPTNRQTQKLAPFDKSNKQMRMSLLTASPNAYILDGSS